jgi:hypothetical protein
MRASVKLHHYIKMIVKKYIPNQTKRRVQRVWNVLRKSLKYVKRHKIL